MIDWKRGAKTGLIADLVYSLVFDISILAIGSFVFAEVLPDLVFNFGFG